MRPLILSLALLALACDRPTVPVYSTPAEAVYEQPAPAVVAPAPQYVDPGLPPAVIVAPRPAVIVAPRPVYPMPGPFLRETTRQTVTTYRTEDKVGVRPAAVAPAAQKVAPALQAQQPTAGGLRGAAQQTGGTFQADNRPKPAGTAFGAVAPRPALMPAPRPAPSFGTTATRPAAPAPRPAPSFSAPSRPSPSYGTTATRGKR